MPVVAVYVEVDSVLSQEQKSARLAQIRARCSVDDRGCWLYQGMLNNAGYAAIKFKFRLWAGHRLVWALARGPIPAGLFVLHNCDVKHCVNPDHMSLGTHLDNMQDKCRKGRNRNGYTGPFPSVDRPPPPERTPEARFIDPRWSHSEWLAALKRGDMVRVRTHTGETMPPSMVTNETPCYVFVGKLKFWRRHGWQVMRQSSTVYRMKLRLVRTEQETFE